MERIDLSKPPGALRVMVYGSTRCGKTHFAASFPKPRFLSDVTEQGYETIRTMDRKHFYDPEIRPEVIAIRSPKSMLEALEETHQEVAAKRSSAPLTLVVDSITYYANLFYDAIEKQEPPGKPDTRKLYGMLLNHMRRVMIRAHEIPINIVWLALDREPEDGQSGILVSGKTNKILPAACQYFFYMRKYNDGSIEKRELRTRQYGAYPAGGRDGGILPDPIIDPTYKKLVDYLTTTTTTK